MSKRNFRKTIISTIIIGAAGGYLLYNAVISSWVYYYSVDEFIESTSQSSNIVPSSKIDIHHTTRLAGKVKPGSIVRNTEKMQLDFELCGQKNSLPVKFVGIMPQNFEEDKEVVVEGKIDANRVFNAKKILTKCESKYKARLTNGN